MQAWNVQVVIKPVNKSKEHEKWRPWHTNEELVAHIRAARQSSRAAKFSRKAGIDVSVVSK